jgi:hypothetical protein
VDVPVFAVISYMNFWSHRGKKGEAQNQAHIKSRGFSFQSLDFYTFSCFSLFSENQLDQNLKKKWSLLETEKGCTKFAKNFAEEKKIGTEREIDGLKVEHL